ncbi:MAG: flagellar biosynthetic protein FliR [Dorea sp.]|jgi:flagellar biosynthetic protein FliR|nr:flagellar biosynthetic protein FliR [Dorea sp.]
MSIDSIAQLTLFSLILMRMSGFVLMNPILGRNNIPARVKAGLIFVLALTVYSSSMEDAFEIVSTVEFAFLLLKEFAAGYVVGYVMHLFFFIVSFAGYIIDYQMGLSMATVYDPQSNAQMPVTGSLLQTWLILLFFAVDGHLALMRILLTSAEIVPYGGIVVTEGLALRIIDIFLECVEMGLRLAIPMIAAEFLVEMGVGILNKVVPQISIFVINIQMKLIVGMGLLVLLFAPTGEFIEKIMTTMMKSVGGILTFL